MRTDLQSNVRLKILWKKHLLGHISTISHPINNLTTADSDLCSCHSSHVRLSSSAIKNKAKASIMKFISSYTQHKQNTHTHKHTGEERTAEERGNTACLSLVCYFLPPPPATDTTYTPPSNQWSAYLTSGLLALP